MMVKRTCPFILEVMSRCNELSPSLNCSSLLWSRRNQLSQVVSKFQSGAMSKQLGSGVRAEGLGWSWSVLPEPPEAVWSAKKGNQMLIHTRSLDSITKESKFKS